MPDMKAATQLREAVHAERMAAALLDRMYSDLLVKMIHHQTGQGSPPTVKDFVTWRDAVSRRFWDDQNSLWPDGLPPENPKPSPPSGAQRA